MSRSEPRPSLGASIPGRITRIAVIAALAVGVGLGGLETVRQIAAQNLERLAVTTSAAALSRSGDAGVLEEAKGWEALCGLFCPVRAKLAGAAIRTNLAVLADPSAPKAVLLKDAAMLLDQAALREPDNGDVWVQRAFIDIARDGVAGQDSRYAISRSYALQPFNRHAGLWRVRVGGDNWSKLDPAMRRATLDEARWLWIVRPAWRPDIERAFTSPAADMAFQIRLASPNPAVIKRESIH